MMIAGFGFRSTATLADLRAALALTGAQPDALASITTKASQSALVDLAQALSVPLIALTEDEITGTPTLTSSSRILTRFGTGSLAEACALVAARKGQPQGVQARLIAPRVITADGFATAAIAERVEP
ncbi:cobalamin biosynthesis protein [Pseudophaeobacter flagellatus]|uniref:cobalamin biosynthesis protein n=1 Tax=Pseudophaeobacter flagellatus TaxID=2899119 RepID=UPI001E28393B|nr:cobalamin biosynthesis protein [Pseudophaeobacter flagellatus]MCD9148575.1 cobalamin biosynthesis protein [Pseudophaeobacter flagellatus]